MIVAVAGKGNMKRIIGTAAAMLAVLTAATPAAARTPLIAAENEQLDPEKLAIARQIIAVVLPPDQREKMLETVLDSMRRNMLAGALQGVGAGDEIRNSPKLQAVFERFMDRERALQMADLREALPDLVEAYARAYVRTFSLDDLKAIKAFVDTPAGARYVQRGAALLSDPDVGAWQRRITAKEAAREDGELARLKTELDAVRADKPSGT